MNKLTVAALATLAACAIGRPLNFIDKQGDTIIEMKKEIQSLQQQIDDSDDEAFKSVNTRC